MQTGGNEQHNHTGRVSSAPYYLVVGVEDGEDEDRERDCGDDTEREVLERNETSNRVVDELTALALIRYSLTDA